MRSTSEMLAEFIEACKKEGLITANFVENPNYKPYKPEEPI